VLKILCFPMLAALIAVCAPLYLTSAAAAQLEYDRGLTRNPPRVQQATLQLLLKPTQTANAVLRVRFQDQRRNTSIVINGGRAPTLLRDDGMAPDAKRGDGTYAALVKVNANQYSIEQRRRLQLAQRFKRVPVFEQRELKRWIAFRPSPVTALRTDVATVVDNFTGVPFGLDPASTLLITDVDVVEDPARTYDSCTGEGTPMGPWTFGHLMTEIANHSATGIHPEDFVEHWLAQWTQAQVINTWNVAARTGAQDLLDAWPRLPNGRLDLAQAPFRLLAIVNRIDLRANSGYGGTSAGEARFVFGLLNCNGALGGVGETTESTVILEYGIDKATCFGVRDWAQQWQALDSLSLGSAAFNAALQDITDQFTPSNARPSQLPNRSAINQVRSNELNFHLPLWQLRESKLCSDSLDCSGNLEHTTIAQTPASDFTFIPALNNTLLDFINENNFAILTGAHTVPLSYPDDQPFLGGAIDPGAGFAWLGSPALIATLINPAARHEFAKATCNGCHTIETGTSFVHVASREPGEESELSDFLTGADMPKTDPVTDDPHTFHELLDRQMKLDVTANMTCGAVGDFAVEEIFMPHLPSAFVH
jgi:hypothetical protein